MKLLELLAAGLSRKEIALALMKGEETIKSQISELGGKLEVVGIRSKDRILKRAVELGILGTNQSIAALRLAMIESKQEYLREKERREALMQEVEMRDDRLQALEQEAQELNQAQEAQLNQLEESHLRIQQFTSDASNMRRVIQTYQTAAAGGGFMLAIPLVVIIILMGGYFWNFLFNRNPLPVTSEAYLHTEKVLNHGNGWCTAWPLEIQERVYGPKLYFSSKVDIYEYDYAPYWLYFRGALMYPIVVSLDGDSPEGYTVFGMRNFWAFYFKQARDPESWYLRYTCALPGPDPAGETELDPAINGWCSAHPTHIEQLESGDHFLYFAKEARMGNYPKHLFYIYFRDEYINDPGFQFWQYNMETEEWIFWIKESWARKHPNFTELMEWKVDYVCANPQD